MDAHWFVADPEALPSQEDMMEQPSDVHKANLERAGFSAAARPAIDEVAAAASLSEDALLEDFRLGAYRSWFNKTIELADYEGDVPPDVPVRIAALKETGVFEQIKLRIAQNGEVLVVGKTPKKEGAPTRTYALVRWNSNGDLTPDKQIKHRHKRTKQIVIASSIAASAVLIGLMVTLVLMMPAESQAQNSDRDSASYLYLMPLFVIVMGALVMNSSNKREK